MKVRVMDTVEGTDKKAYWLWCPACEDTVRITSDWGFNGDVEKPTFTPSILTAGVQWGPDEDFYKPSHSGVARGQQIVCHSFLTDGVWNFLGDCTHAYAGQSLPAVDVPDWLNK